MQAKAPVTLQQSENMALDKLSTGEGEVGTEVSSKSANTELNTMMKAKKQDRKIDIKDIDYLIKEFNVNKIQATNVLRKCNLGEAIQYLIDN